MSDLLTVQATVSCPIYTDESELEDVLAEAAELFSGAGVWNGPTGEGEFVPGQEMQMGEAGYAYVKVSGAVDLDAVGEELASPNEKIAIALDLAAAELKLIVDSSLKFGAESDPIIV